MKDENSMNTRTLLLFFLVFCTINFIKIKLKYKIKLIIFRHTQISTFFIENVELRLVYKKMYDFI